MKKITNHLDGHQNFLISYMRGRRIVWDKRQLEVIKNPIDYREIGTADPGKPAARIAAVQIFFNDVLNDGPEEPVLSLEAALILDQEPLEIMEEHPVEDRALGMSRTIESRHGGRMASRNGPSPRI
jgi:hypothetical protein